jgi:hypothetical protein
MGSNRRPEMISIEEMLRAAEAIEQRERRRKQLTFAARVYEQMKNDLKGILEELKQCGNGS